ncbi:TPA: ShlB/FhaC/HecB family hemolysin secretion/activation protein [Yersinia enterocolitica]|uniref:ShlB/FhaC/HecB family hemolysin secretion/activation protein n=1 Tax=Yersinia enterocolitica TaxID=630 RepID=UPI000327E1FA|nr:ShlB/FhaC/HecB family hemolysin secretion/activation protein [Yersinia enterocolitica]EKN3327370.1 ShlB/FhaC/HecB family hemolysin secretion/activation protein [Yersinia enterocolitica]EKN3351508.1 ShlB/FhaC/HecB family hemolysin secretion/activation protein [Yersinia enterocolitica]EKN3357636.1 ShlB/FhaC/HecB family hemolysin secretion/activation protein [Yersinia enterocolitica]EKN3364070.1 ShlB/FhaC/HecB family hemolysin secretion/activation protein [Yersinia enterocolitica]EKN3382143.1 
MIKKRTALCFLLSAGAHANSVPEIDISASIEQSRQSLQSGSNEMNRLIEERQQPKLKQPELVSKEEIDAPKLDDASPCLPISGIYIQGITLLSTKELESLTAIPEQCISSENINLLARELTYLYLANGYITARIQFIPTDADGELGLDVTEGFIESIESDDPELNIETIFPDMVGQPLNIKQLDQSLDQANRLPSNKITIDILPGTQPGGSILRVSNTRSKPWHLTTSLDNYGNKNTGKWLSRNAFSFDNPFGLSDSINLNISSPVDKPEKNYSRSSSLFYSVPYGALTFSGFANYSEYRYPVKLQFNEVKLWGETQQYNLRTDYAFYRDQDQINSLNAQLTYKQVENYLEDQKIIINSPTLTVFELGINHQQMLSNGIFNANFSIEQGLTWFGADQNLPANYQDSQFTKAKAVLTSQQYFKVFDDFYLFKNQFYGQYTRDRLPGTEWLTITDSSAIRGFSRNTLAADRGWYLQNTLSRNFTLGNTTITPRWGVDVGRVQQQSTGWSSAMGFSAGINLSYQDFNIDIEASRGRLLSGKSTEKDPNQILARFSYSF